MEPETPVLPPEVLEPLLGSLSVASLRSSRLVNPHWAKTAIAPMRKKSGSVSFRLQTGTGNRRLEDPFSFSHEDLERFVACFQASDGNFPVTKFEVALSPIDRDSSDTTETNLDKFFESVSSMVTELGLTFDIGRNQPKNWPGIYTYPQLTSLKLKVKADTYPGFKKYLKSFTQETFDFVERIIGQAPNLNTVSLEFGNHIPIKQYNYINCAETVCFEVISERGVFLDKLTHLELTLSDMKTESDFSKLNSVKGVKLKTARVNVGGDWAYGLFRNNIIKNFLASQADSLVTLEIEGRVAATRYFEIPALRKLEQLKILQDVRINGLSSADLPALKCVHISASSWNRILFLFNWQDKLNSVEELILGQLLLVEERIQGRQLSLCKEETYGISRVARYFPNVTKLEISPTFCGMVQTVYKSFPKLVELSLTTIKGFELMDQIITGLNEKQLQALEREMDRKPHQKGESCRRRLRAAKLTSIKSLQKLETLRLRTRQWDAPIEFGYASSFVLKSMKSLKCLDLGIRCFPESHERTQAVLLDLKKKLCVTYDDPPEPRKERVKVEVQPLNS